MTMSASATKCRPPPAQMPLTAAITGFHTWLCHAVNCSVGVEVRRESSCSASWSQGDLRTSTPVWNAEPLPC